MELKGESMARDVHDFSLLDYLPGGACILRADLEIVHWNQRLADWSGIASEQITGSSALAGFPMLSERHLLDGFEQCRKNARGFRFAVRDESGWWAKVGGGAELIFCLRKIPEQFGDDFYLLATESVASAAVADENAQDAGAKIQTFDRAYFLETFAGLEDVAEATVTAFLTNLPQMLSAIEKALADGDFGGLEIAAHTMKGAVAIFFAEKARGLASNIEHAARDKKLDGVLASFDELKAEVGALEPALRELFPLRKSA